MNDLEKEVKRKAPKLNSLFESLYLTLQKSPKATARNSSTCDYEKNSGSEAVKAYLLNNSPSKLLFMNSFSDFNNWENYWDKD